jgi:hypothetical protein
MCVCSWYCVHGHAVKFVRDVDVAFVLEVAWSVACIQQVFMVRIVHAIHTAPTGRMQTMESISDFFRCSSKHADTMMMCSVVRFGRVPAGEVDVARHTASCACRADANVVVDDAAARAPRASYGVCSSIRTTTSPAFRICVLHNGIDHVTLSQYVSVHRMSYAACCCV